MKTCKDSRHKQPPGAKSAAAPHVNKALVEECEKTQKEHDIFDTTKKPAALAQHRPTPSPGKTERIIGMLLTRNKQKSTQISEGLFGSLPIDRLHPIILIDLHETSGGGILEEYVRKNAIALIHPNETLRIR